MRATLNLWIWWAMNAKMLNSSNQILSLFALLILSYQRNEISWKVAMMLTRWKKLHGLQSFGSRLESWQQGENFKQHTLDFEFEFLWKINIVQFNFHYTFLSRWKFDTLLQVFRFILISSGDERHSWDFTAGPQRLTEESYKIQNTNISKVLEK